MAFKYTGDATLGVALTVETPKPLDNRTVVNNLDELYSIPEKYAYQGMTVANIDNGNIYMLIDKSKIKYKEGWKASYESIQIITCTEAEYKEWSENTTDDFRPIDESKTYLHAETYYYIYEDSLDDDQFYLSAEWGKKIEEQLKQKALNTTVVQIRTDLDNTIASLSDYATLEELTTNYVSNDSLALSLTKYYTKEETDDIFVTKESLRGEGMEGDDFVFVTKKEYEEDQQAIQDELDKTLKVDGDGSLESITVGQIKSPVVEGESQLVVDVRSEGLFIGEDQIATESDIPNLVTLTEEEYLKLVEEGTVEPDTYYYVYDVTNDAKVYITKEYLDQNYHTTNQYQSWVATNYYSKKQIDEIVQGLQKLGNYVTTEDIKAYYTIQQVDDKFLTKENAQSTYATQQSLSDLSDQIAEDQQAIQDELDKTLKVDGDGSLESITVGQIKSPVVEGESQLVVDVRSEGLFIGEDQIATESDIPNLVTLTEEEYLKLVEEGTVEPDTYYYVYDVTNDAKVYITKEYLDQNYHTTNQYQSWVATNYYSKKQIDEIVQGLQKLGNYVTTEDIKAYYTIQQVDDKFLTKENAQSTYATQQSLSDLSDQIAEDYVTKESLRGDSPETGDDDFIFVTQKKYQDDQAAAAKEFSTELLKSTSVETSDITIQKIGEKEVQQGTTGEPSEETGTEQVIESSVKLTTEDNRLFAGGKQVAITEEVPKLVCLPQADYDDLVENSKTEEDTYYCTYGEKDLQDTGYVRSEYLIERYYTKAEVEELISQAVAELQKKIDALQPGSSVEVDGENEQLIF